MNIASLKYFKNVSSIGQISVYAEARNWVINLGNYLISSNSLILCKKKLHSKKNLKLHVQYHTQINYLLVNYTFIFLVTN